MWSITGRTSAQRRPQCRRGDFDRIALAQLLMVGCAVMFGLIKHAQAQFVNSPPPPPPPVFNPSSPNTVPQPSYKPVTPSTPSITPSTPSAVPSGEVTSPAVPRGEATPSVTPSTTVRSERRASFEKRRSVHHHRARARPVTYRCGNFGCIRTEAWAFPCQYYSTYCPYGYYRYSGW
jgi:hypothetical protein